MPETLHCTYCGHAFGPQQTGWPRTCSSCGRVSYRNPLPVVVVLLPVSDRGGLLVIRRSVAVDPGIGQFALPGGYIDINDPSWQHAAARELREETGIVLPPETFKEFGVRSAPNGTLLIFALAAPVSSDALPAFRATNETSEMTVITSPTELAFSLHSEMANTWFAGRRVGLH
jgi:ADP-ribose pyrophosphatase YjhB (NUDIX family)